METTLNDGELKVEAIVNKYYKFYERIKAGLIWSDMIGDSEYVKFRLEIVNAILDSAISDLKCTDCSYKSVGTISNYSDYDVSVNGQKAPEIIIEFNRRFRTIFDKESATIFDTNIYGASFAEPISTTQPSQKPKHGYFDVYRANNSFEGTSTFKYVRSDDDKQDVLNQRHWALTKLNLNLHPDEWLHLSGILFSNNPDELKMLNGNILHLKELVPDRNDTRAMNIMYGKMLQEWKQYFILMNNGESNGDCVDESCLKRHYKNTLSRANYFGNGMYFTQGAYMHVVGNIQTKLKVPITKNEYIDSFIENMADLFKELNNGEESCPKTLKTISKYFSRATDALVKLGYVDEEDKYDASENVRSTLRNKAECDVNYPSKMRIPNSNSDGASCVLPRTTKLLSGNFLKSIGLEDCTQLRSFMINYTLDVLGVVPSLGRSLRSLAR